MGIVSFAYVLLYSGFVFQLFIIFLYLALENVFSKRLDYKILLYSLGGTVLGLIINPYFPNNIFMLYTQIFKVNLIANLYNAEWKPWPFFEFMKNNLMVLFYFVISIVFLVKHKKITKNKIFYLLLALFFLVFTLKSRRMQEYLIPFSVLMVVFILKEFIKDLDKNKFYNLLKTGTIIFIVFLMTFNFYLLRKDITNNSFLYNYDDCAEWMKENIPESSLVFINAYTFPYLFFKNSGLRYTHGVDLTYSYLYNPEEFERYMNILTGKAKGEDDFIIKDYSPDYLFVGKVKQDVKLFEYIVKNKENYKIEFEDGWCAVLKVV